MGTDVKNIITEINSGYATCPSCKSSEWKSARMIVMENTKHISGSFNGVREPSYDDISRSFNGVREPSYSGDFFTSDDWFSKENALSANVNLMSTGGLVGEVYRLMSSFNLITRMPEEPNIPAPNIAAPNIPAPMKKLARQKNHPPVKPQPPYVLNAPQDKSWFFHFKSYMKTPATMITNNSISLAIILGCYMNNSDKISKAIENHYTMIDKQIDHPFEIDVLFIKYTFEGIMDTYIYFIVFWVFILITSILVNLKRSFSGNKRAKQQHELLLIENSIRYEQEIKKYNEYRKFEDQQKKREEETVLYNEKKEEETVLYNEQLKSYNNAMIEYQYKVDKALTEHRSKVDQAMAEHQYKVESAMAEYKSEVHKAMINRELLWHRSRVCMRCGTAYLGA